MVVNESSPPDEHSADQQGGGLGDEMAPVAAAVPPYGCAINEAIAGGDLQQMKAVAEAARKAVYGVEFKRVTADQVDEVTEALQSLEVAISRLESGSKPDS